MSKKKSYMDRQNILNEGFFSKLFSMFKPKQKKNTSREEIIKRVENDPKVRKSLNKFNKSTENLEKLLTRLMNKKVTLDRFEVKDFIKK